MYHSESMCTVCIMILIKYFVNSLFTEKKMWLLTCTGPSGKVSSSANSLRYCQNWGGSSPWQKMWMLAYMQKKQNSMRSQNLFLAINQSATNFLFNCVSYPSSKPCTIGTIFDADPLASLLWSYSGSRKLEISNFLYYKAGRFLLYFLYNDNLRPILRVYVSRERKWHFSFLKKFFLFCTVYFFLQARVRRPLLRLCRPFMIFEGYQDSNPECCRNKLARYRLSHPSLSDLATHPWKI